MSGLSPKFPLEIDDVEGAYRTTKSFKELAQQNLKNLILTAPGERIMFPDFGVGLRNFLFENVDNNIIDSKISARINIQVSRYLPYIEIGDIRVMKDANTLYVELKYTISPLKVSDLLQLSISEEI